MIEGATRIAMWERKEKFEIKEEFEELLKKDKDDLT